MLAQVRPYKTVQYLLQRNARCQVVSVTEHADGNLVVSHGTL